LLDDVAVSGAVVPGIWPLETANVLLAAERRNRKSLAERQKALQLLGNARSGWMRKPPDEPGAI
jgi:hypothetical protein